MELFMYVVGVIIASQLGIFILYSWGKKNRGDDGEVRDENGVANKSSDDENGEFRPDIARDVDVVIGGACVAGAALAYALAKDGRQVHVIERDLTEQDRIVGELLQPGGYLKLVDLGLEDCVEEIDFQKVFEYALYMEGKKTKLSCPLEKFSSDVSGRGFHNGRFVQRLRSKAASLANVTSLVEEKGVIKGVQCRTKDSEILTVLAPLTVVCDGCASNLRRSLSKPKTRIMGNGKSQYITPNRS